MSDAIEWPGRGTLVRIEQEQSYEAYALKTGPLILELMLWSGETPRWESRVQNRPTTTASGGGPTAELAITDVENHLVLKQIEMEEAAARFAPMFKRDSFSAELARRLNALLVDPSIRADIEALIASRVPASDATCEHPHIQVTEDGMLGVLGLLNGCVPKGPAIAAVYDEDLYLESFTALDLYLAIQKDVPSEPT